jgi:hypothetical protein
MTDNRIYSPDIAENIVAYILFGFLILIVPLIEVYKAITAS